MIAGQPLVAEDTWWHLAMGRAYATAGPWLAEDPFLFTATGPPAPAAWLADLALFAVQRATGFAGLRVLHAALVAAILASAWRALASASHSRAFASFGTSVFAALAAYRLFQLRPELVTLLATVWVLRIVSEPRALSRARLARIALGFALWANAHAGFVLGIALLGAGAAGAALDLARGGAPVRARDLAGALAAAVVGSLANPLGARAHLLYFTAGTTSPALAQIADEWAPLHLFSLPIANLPPSPLSWLLVWALALAAALVLARRAQHRALDLALGAATALAAVALLAAVRLVWLGIAPLLWLGGALHASGVLDRRAVRWTLAGGAVALVPAFFWGGDGPRISRGLHAAVYARPYPPEKYHAHAVWFLHDTDLEGRIWNDYASGNFLAWWLGPRARTFVNGSLNVAPDVFADAAAIQARTGRRPDESFSALLDRHAIDVFFGVGVPSVPRANQPIRYTTAHLEDTPGWRLVFRNVDSAVYLRADERNRANLERVAAYYARERVPFDLARGFDSLAALRAAPGWAAAHGLLPADTRALDAAPAQRAALYALLGGYEAAAALDRALLHNAPHSLPTARGLVWTLLHRGSPAERRLAANRLAALRPSPNTIASALVEAESAWSDLDSDTARARLARLPLLSESEAGALLASLQPPLAREDQNSPSGRE